ncbi:MAG: methionyl-tRNA formyltransferase [Candidatus Krumholzibacteriota bacterium]|nr:methionyl-tRNA formyltransferase [Candidatus Krumholzibacteriota bacterium]
MPRVIFFGSPEFALPSLEALIPTEFCPEFVVTQPDRPAGRGRNSKPTAVRALAEQNGLAVRVISSFKGEGAVETLTSSGADFFVVVAFGLIFPEKMLRIPSKEPVNLHASLLPAYRGASPVNMAIKDGMAFTGVSTMRMVKELDAGPVFMQAVEPVDPMEDAGSLSSRLAQKGAGLLLKTLRGIEAGILSPVEQPQEGSSTVGLLKKEDGSIPWEKNALEVHNHIRGMNPWPGSHTSYQGEYIKIHGAEPLDLIPRGADPGQILSAAGNSLVVACGSGAVRVTRVQVRGKKAMDAEDFMRGYRLEEGGIFGKETR